MYEIVYMISATGMMRSQRSALTVLLVDASWTIISAEN